MSSTKLALFSMTYDKLTPRQWQIIKLVSEGMKNAEIGYQLGTTKFMIMNYLREIMDVTGMSSRLELALWYVSRDV